jgi:hypothetical protein
VWLASDALAAAGPERLAELAFRLLAFVVALPFRAAVRAGEAAGRWIASCLWFALPLPFRLVRRILCALWSAAALAFASLRRRRRAAAAPAAAIPPAAVQEAASEAEPKVDQPESESEAEWESESESETESELETESESETESDSEAEAEEPAEQPQDVSAPAAEDEDPEPPATPCRPVPRRRGVVRRSVPAELRPVPRRSARLAAKQLMAAAASSSSVRS